MQGISLENKFRIQGHIQKILKKVKSIHWLNIRDNCCKDFYLILFLRKILTDFIFCISSALFTYYTVIYLARPLKNFKNVIFKDYYIPCNELNLFC